MKANRKIAGRVLGLVMMAAMLAIMLAGPLAAPLRAQTPMGSTPASPKADTAIIFQPSQPLIRSAMQQARDLPNNWGFNASFSDYGFGGGLFLGHTFGPNVSAELSAEISTASGTREFDLISLNKVNRIFVIPIMASMQYRLFRDGLSDNLRPYVTAGAGPVVAMTTPYAEDFFMAFADQTSKIVPGGFVGIGAKFGTDPKSTLGASLRYFIIPYPGGIESTTTESLPNLSGLFLSVSYGMNF
ncbi:MAG: outer membrane beta-barrel protein [Bacteroidota bacterium]|nr:outer membrane beta-barrel protein [Bacteroidota bacterium]MDP4287711.1 outer membrane beta-barrel protein [Bacteroidota bacterium]